VCFRLAASQALVLYRWASTPYNLPSGGECSTGAAVDVTGAPASAAAVQVWDNPEAFMPERFPLDQPMPNEQDTDYR
jgi:carotene epsilon-monooxygenase